MLQTVLDAWNQVFAHALVRENGVTAYVNVAAVTIGVVLVTQWLRRRSRVIRREGATDEPDETAPALGTEPDASEPAPVPLSELSVRAWLVDRTIGQHPPHYTLAAALSGLRNGALR
jgi:hypothetical protein